MFEFTYNLRPMSAGIRAKCYNSLQRQCTIDVYKRQVEVSWFDRPDEVRERVAEILRDTVMGEGYPLVQVIFTTLVEERFYEYEQE